MPSQCVVKYCRNRGGHFFPRDPEIFKKWLAAVGRPGFVPSKHSRVCSAHFQPSDYSTEGFYTGLPLTRKWLKKNAVPTSSVHSKEPSDSALNVSMRGKRKRGDTVTKLSNKSSKVVLLIQDPYYSGCSSGNEASDDVTGTDGCSDVESVKICSERESSIESQIFEYDVTSRPSLREVSTKDSDASNDRVYTSEQQDVVIDKLNSIRSDDSVRKLLGPKLTKSIETHLRASGNFTKLDQLLQVQSVGPKTIRSLSDKLLGVVPEKTRSRSSSPGSNPPGRRNRSLMQLVSPSLSEEFCLSVTVLGTVIVDVTSISWVLVDSKTKTLLDWKSVPIDVPLSSLRDVIVQAAVIEKSLPEADLFVLEDPILGTRGGHHFKSHLTCALATSLHTHRESDGGVKMALIKNRLVEKHFNATIGSETVSLQPFIQDIIDQKVAVGRSLIFISQDLVKYYKNLEPVAREQLSRAGLLSVTCIDLVLNKRDTLDRRKITEPAK